MRILGLDIGSTSVKAVEIDSAFGRFEIHEYHERAVPAGASPAEQARELIAGLPKAPDRIALCLRSGQATFRNLHLPTREKKAIQASVNFELDDDLPFPLEQAVYDYSVLSQADKMSHVHVAATLKRYLEAALAEWGAAGIDPDLVTTEAWAYRSLLNRVLAPAAQEQPTLLLQIGHERTTIYGHWRGMPILTRELNWGGRDLTFAISQKYGVPLEQAEAAKTDHAVLISDAEAKNAKPEQLDLSATVMQPLEELFLAIRQAEFACKNVTRSSPAQILLAGGTSLLSGLPRFIEQTFEIPAHPLQALSAIAPSGVSYSEHTDALFVLATALGMCLVGPERGQSINFRKGAYSKQGRALEFNFATLKKPLLGLGAVTASLVLSLTIQGSVYHSRLDDADSRLERAVRGFFGQLSASGARSYLSNISKLKATINKELTQQREASRLLGENTHSPLEFLKGLSAAIPKDTIVDMTQFQVGASATSAPYKPEADTTASLTFLVANPQMAEKLTSVVNGKLQNLQRSPIEEVTVGEGEKKWKVTFTGKPTEDSYGH